MAALRCMLLVAALLGCAAAQTYTYDEGGRLVRVAYAQGGGVVYQYDSTDNITAVVSLSVPPAPADVQISRTSPSSVRLSWAEAQGATGYRIERRPVDGSAWEQVAEVGATTRSYVDAAVRPDQEYVYRVAAVGSDGAGAFSADASTEASAPVRPQISSNGVLNGASFWFEQGLAPGAIISIFGPNIGVRMVNGDQSVVNAMAAGAPLPLELAGHSVLIDGRQAPLFFVAGRREPDGSITGQINAQAPWETPTGSAVSVVVRRTGDDGVSESVPESVKVMGASPALFTFQFGVGPAAVVNVKVREDDGVIAGSIAQPVGSLPGASTQPAARGGIITLYATGLGAVDPPAQTGSTSLDAVRRTVATPMVLIGGVEARVLFSGLAPEFVGLYQINAVVPQGAPAGDEVPVQIEIDSLRSRTGTTIAVRP